MNEFISKSKLAIYQERMIFDRKPITAQLAITEFCNLNCHYCHYGFEKTKSKPKIYMDFNLFKIVIDRLQALGVRSFVFSGTGEPTINKDFPAMIEYLEENKIPYGLNSNMLVKFQASPKWLKANIDGYCRESYSYKKGVDKFEQVYNNLIDYKIRNPKVKVIAQCIAMTPDDVGLFFKKFEHTPIDYISIRPMESEHKVYDDFTLQSIRIFLQSIKSKKLQANYKWRYVNTPRIDCFANWSIISVNAGGGVAYCCYKWNEETSDILDPDIVEKKAKHKTDIMTCAVPCRLSGVNDFQRDFQPRYSDAEFV